MHVKIAFYLDPLTRHTGALRLIPGSHLIGDSYADSLSAQIGESDTRWDTSGEDVPAVVLETTPGDLVVFNHNAKHAAFGGGRRRRMFTMNLCQRYPEEKLDALRDYIGGAARFLDRAQIRRDNGAHRDGRTSDTPGTGDGQRFPSRRTRAPGEREDERARARVVAPLVFEVGRITPGREL